MTPIFLISLPRSGSTFLQKILMGHPEIASTAEPWFLLPLCYMRKKEGVAARYGHAQSVNAFRRLERHCGQAYLDSEISLFASAIYKKFSKGTERYFLDKTPRYYWILDDLMRIFEDAKFIVLLRNPISVFASSLEAFRDNSTRRLDHLDADLYEAPIKIANFISDHSKRVHVLTYEELVSDTERCIREICSHLELNYLSGMVENSFQLSLIGHGDHIGARCYKEVKVNTDKWQKIINTSYRRWRLKKLVNKYPEGYLAAGGYDRSALLLAIDEHKTAKVNFLEYLYCLEEYLVRAYKMPMRSRNV